MSNTVEFVFVLVVSMIGSSQAASCYQCSYTQSSGSLQSTCNVPFNPTMTKNCQGTICSWVFISSTSTTSFFSIDLGCLNASGSAIGDPCTQYRNQYNVFSHGDSCCYTATDQGSTSVTACFCHSDYCNADKSNPQAPPTPPPGSLPGPTGSTAHLTVSMMKLSTWATMIVVAIIAAVANIG